MFCNLAGFGMRRWHSTKSALLLALSVCAIGLMVLMGLSPASAYAKGPFDSAIPTVSTTQLPVQAQNMLTLIYQGGPFRYDKDGSVFGNRERLLPAKQRGYYLEYTVTTPHVRNRGARRIICGGTRASAPDACYYTDDHYASYRRIVQ